MSMHKVLKFVQGSVSKKDFNPVLKHFVIEDGFVRGFNGSLALCAPIDMAVACKPKADQLVDALSHCDDEVVLAITGTGRLRVKSGRYAASVDCVPDDSTPHATPQGNRYPVEGAAILAAMTTLGPVVGDDASRPWTNGIMFVADRAYATNNVIATEMFLGTTLVQGDGAVVVPRDAIREVVRVGEPPSEVQLDKNSITFHYPDGKWIYTQLLLPDQWPNIPGLLDSLESGTLQAFPADFFHALAKIKKRCDKVGRVHFGGGSMGTVPLGQEDGSHYDIPQLVHDGVWQVDMLQLLEGVAELIDFSMWPRPALFTGKNGWLRGALAGLRV